MVTTNSIEEIRKLFGEASEKIRQLVSDLDNSENDLVRVADALVKEAIRVAMPTLKYVDDEIKVGPDIYRGIWLDKHYILTRKGQIVNSTTRLRIPSYDTWIMVGSMAEVGKAIKRLSNLGKILSKALSKIDERRAGLAETVEMLQQASAVFHKK